MVETKKLKEVAARLNKESDSLNTIIQKIQDKVNSYNIGLEVWQKNPFLSREITTGDGSRQSTMLEKFLGYRKFSEGWGFAYQEKGIYYERTEEHDYDWEKIGESIREHPVLLLKASREVRIAALECLQRLVDQIYDEVEAALDTIDKTKKLANEL